MKLNFKFSPNELFHKIKLSLRGGKIFGLLRTVLPWLLLVAALGTLAGAGWLFYQYAYLPSRSPINPEVKLVRISEERFNRVADWINGGAQALNDAMRQTHRDPFK